MSYLDVIVAWFLWNIVCPLLGGILIFGIFVLWLGRD